MAFFKFRQTVSSAPKAPGRADEAASTAAETVESLRKRARHRLIGAVVLVLVAVIGFPLLFDTQPRPVAIDAPITIPDRDRAPPLAMPAATPPSAGASVPGVSAAASLSEREEVVPSAARGNGGTAARAGSPPAPVAPPAAATAEASGSDGAKAQTADARARQEEAAAKAKRDAEVRARKDDAARALAALEGRRIDKPATTASDTGGRFIVQVGAFAEVEKVREARERAERAGLKTYTQVVDTSAGKRTRVRVGPFSSRADAEKAADTLKKAGLPGSILTL